MLPFNATREAVFDAQHLRNESKPPARGGEDPAQTSRPGAAPCPPQGDRLGGRPPVPPPVQARHDRRDGGLIKRAALRYKRRYFWADVDDLQQAAWVAVLLARRTWDPGEGPPFEAYAWRASINSLHKTVRKDSAPVSAGDRELDELLGLHRAPLSLIEGIAQSTTDIDRVLDLKRLIEKTTASVRRITSALRNGYLAKMVLLEEVPPRKVAELERVPVAHVYKATNATRRVLSEDEELWKLWKELR